MEYGSRGRGYLETTGGTLVLSAAVKFPISSPTLTIPRVEVLEYEV